MPFTLNKVNFISNRRKIIREVSLQLRSGEFYGLLGPNGSGKTTLLDLMLGHKKPSSGTVLLKGNKIEDYKKTELARMIALVPQNFSLNFPFTVQEMVLMGRYPHLGRFTPPGKQDLDLIRKVMLQTEIWDLRQRYVTELSGGEQQRVIFARALAQNTPILFLDEATSNLDIKHTLGLLSLCSQLSKAKGTTVIAVFQDINLAAMFCDYLLFLKQGQLKAQGRPADILKPKLLAELFEIDTKVSWDIKLKCPQVRFQPNQHIQHLMENK